MDLFEILSDEHQAVRQKINHCLRAREFDREEITAICTLLTLHTQVEEKLLYPQLESPRETHDLMVEAEDAHRSLKEYINTLQHADISAEVTRNALEEMLQTLEEHVRQEENIVFPRARKLLGDDEIETLGRHAQDMKQAAGIR
jgi:hemerythrin superfamily protein